ncbi:MAG: MFS transporter [Terriglobia bacterium]
MSDRVNVNATVQSGAPGRENRWLGASAGFLGWSIDAFDFFVVVFLVGRLAAQFGVSKADIVWTLTATLAMRPVGAFVFGLFSDRYGRRLSLIGNVVCFTVLEVACGLAPSFTAFLILRALFGIGMGGEWGVGASVAMETVPIRWRGLLSGILQAGYAFGYLMAAAAARFVLPAWGWRAMFFVGVAPALAALYVCYRMPEPRAWSVHRAASARAVLDTLGENKKEFAYLVLLLILMMFCSHGTQDLYPDFLMTVHHVAPRSAASIAMLYNVGAILGGIIFGELSQRAGRRIGMQSALILSLLVIPLWAFSHSVAMLTLGAFLMQVGIQGAWGVIPAHLTELAPPSARSLVPGMAYQLAILFAAFTNTFLYALRDHIGYAWALGGFQIVAIISAVIVISLGRERHSRDFMLAD